MGTFEDEMWSPPGPRWVVQLQLGPGGRDLGDAYAATLDRWWSDREDPRPFPSVFEVLPRSHRHITLYVIDRPAGEVSHVQLELLKAALLEHLSRARAFSGLQWGPAVVNAVAVELYLQPHPELTQLRSIVAGACRSVFSQAAEAKRWRAHSAIAYRRDTADTSTLTSWLLRTPGPAAGYLGPAEDSVTDVTLALVDPWSEHGFAVDEASTVVIPLQTDFRPPATEVIELRATDAADDAVTSVQELAAGAPWTLMEAGSLVTARATVGDELRPVTILVGVDRDRGTATVMLSGLAHQPRNFQGTETQVCTQAARWLTEFTG